MLDFRFLRLNHHFNPRTREECDTLLRSSLSTTYNFNPRTREECDKKSFKKVLTVYHFNPRTREECDLGDCSSATNTLYFNPRTREECDWQEVLCLRQNRSISIHALARSATKTLYPLVRTRYYFNPRTREECDCCPLRAVSHLTNFNPRTREECDVFDILSRDGVPIFQSTHSRGVRPIYSITC